MFVKNHMLNKEELTVVELEESIESTLKKMAQGGFLSLPVVSDGVLSGLVMKETIYRGYVEEGYDNFQGYITHKKVKDIYNNKVHIIHENEEIENASHLLGELRIPFLAVLDSDNKFTGILTHSAIFEAFTEVLGINKGLRIVVEMPDIPGELSKLTTLIKEENINIKNIAMIESEIKNNVRVVVRIDTDSLDDISNKIKNEGFQIIY